MKIVLPIAFLLSIFSFSLSADQLTHKFKNPSFSGIGTGAHYLTIENQEKSRKDKIKADIEAALKAAELWDFVQSSPAGVNTMVGDQGTALSGGQAQRLAIARALLKDAPIVVRDGDKDVGVITRPDILRTVIEGTEVS